MTYWPRSRSIEVVRKVVEDRILADWKLEFARDQGLVANPALQKLAAMDEEKYLLQQFHDRVISPGIQVSAEDIEAYYTSNRESYRTGDEIRLSYVVFPTEEEAQNFYNWASDASVRWWLGQLGVLASERSDVHVVTETEDFDFSQSIPDSVSALVELGRDREANEVLDPISYHSGGWAVSRVLRRDRPGYRPLEKLAERIRQYLIDTRTNARMQELIEEGKVRFALNLYPENLVE
jgi:hypothetical protein